MNFKEKDFSPVIVDARNCYLQLSSTLSFLSIENNKTKFYSKFQILFNVKYTGVLTFKYVTTVFFHLLHMKKGLFLDLVCIYLLVFIKR